MISYLVQNQCPKWKNLRSCQNNVKIETKICNSKREARELINGNSISINGEKVNKEDLLLKKENALYGKFIILKKGKKNYYLINLE